MAERRIVAIRGVVQGVGLRPFIRGLAVSFNLRGQVRNDAAGVIVDLEGPGGSIRGFLAHLLSAPPPLAVIDSISVETAAPTECSTFTVAASDRSGPTTALVSPDAGICAACLAELVTPSNRRHRHPFISCTQCGPRFTIVREVPFDRSRTTMAEFPMCGTCRQEYESPGDRRFHAQPIACPDCGPTLAFRWTRSDGDAGKGEVALALAVASLGNGKIVAIKGLGGYHLGCDARNEAAVGRLRNRKHRESRPLAVMVRDLAAARDLATISEGEAGLLTSTARPIVLVSRRADGQLAESVAPNVSTIGLMLPYTPLHHLLVTDCGGPLVMTSGNRSDEPIRYQDADALAGLEGIADCFLTHDRAIATRVDDSVVREARGGPTFIRRSRGYAPRPLRLAAAFPVPVLALGGHLKNTFCLGRGHQAFVSQHVGDLEHPAALVALRDSIGHYQRLFAIAPTVVGHDLHPDYASTRLAETMGLPTVAVQHHHAHVAGCAAEHGVSGPVIGVAFDGSGAGTDGAVWGGEFLLVDGSRCTRLGHLGYVPMPGGERAVREPWRVAAAHLFAAYGPEADTVSLPARTARPREWGLIWQMLERGFQTPPTSSVGRLFDAVAALTGIRDLAAYEGQAAIELETAADRTTARSYPPELLEEGNQLVASPGVIVRGVVDDLKRGRSVAEVAGAFHNAIKDLVVEVVERLAGRTGTRRVALTGGVFQNVLLLERTAEALSTSGLEVLIHRRVPSNDGGLSLGQAVVAADSFGLGG